MDAAVMGIDFGSTCARAVVFRALDGTELGHASAPYPTGVVPVPGDPDAVRHDPHDYLQVLQEVMAGAVRDAGIDPSRIRAIGLDCTGSSMVPLKEDGSLLCDDPRFSEDPDAMLWLWKDHSAASEAEEITDLCKAMARPYLDAVGGRCAVELPWPRLVHAARKARKVFAAAFTWAEVDDWLPFVLCGGGRAEDLKRNRTSLVTKWLYDDRWGGCPDAAFLARLDPALCRIGDTVRSGVVRGVEKPCGTLCAAWARKTGLREGTPVAMGLFDGHAGGLGAGIRPGVFVTTVGTSASDLIITPMDRPMPEIPGMFCMAPDGIIPGWYLVESGQSAVGDILGWYVRTIAPQGMDFADLDRKAAALRPGAGGLLALDWWNGNRSVFLDASLSGLVVGLTLQTKPEAVWRALVEGTAFGSRMIQERIEAYGYPLESVIACGGIPRKNPLLMQIYADVFGKRVAISRATEPCALGMAVAASVAGGVWGSFREALSHMTGVLDASYAPDPAARGIYDRIYALYRDLSYAFAEGRPADLHGVMAGLRKIAAEA